MLRKLQAIAVLAVILCQASAAVASESDGCRLPPGELSVQDFPEDPSVYSCEAVGRVVELDGMSLEVPQPGNGVRVSVDGLNGEGKDFSILVETDGTLEFLSTNDPEAVGTNPEAVVPTSTPVGAPSACSDGAYTDKDEKQYYSWQWYLGDGVRPTGMSTASVISRLKDAVDNITGSYNDCGYADQVDASASYQGVASQESQLNASGGETHCASDGDGRSVVDFGNMDDHGNPPAGVECTWLDTRLFANNAIKESDVRFNSTDYDWINLPASCSGAVDLEAVATHEFGHSFGMGHVSESAHGNLTMSTGIGRCTSSARTLGRGDILSLRNTY